MKKAFCILIIYLSTACSNIRYLGIETYDPAEITYPPGLRQMLIVNNASPQSPDTGYEFTLLGIPQDSCRAQADSALFDACRSLGTALAESNYFDDVRLFEERTRQDETSYADIRLDRETVEDLCQETGADAIISFDRLLFDMKKNIRSFADEGYVSGSISIDITGTARSYLPGRDAPLIAVLVSDSLLWTEWGLNIDHLNTLLPTPDDALRIAANYIGAKIYPAFVPHWTNETRWFYTGIGARWKEATAYADNSKWENALERWQYIHTRATRWKEKARSASNLALAFELTGHLDKALEQASLAHRLFEQNNGEDDDFTRLQQLYVEALKKRIENDNKLNLQIGEE